MARSRGNGYLSKCAERVLGGQCDDPPEKRGPGPRLVQEMGADRQRSVFTDWLRGRDEMLGRG